MYLASFHKKVERMVVNIPVAHNPATLSNTQVPNLVPESAWSPLEGESPGSTAQGRYIPVSELPEC